MATIFLAGLEPADRPLLEALAGHTILTPDLFLDTERSTLPPNVRTITSPYEIDTEVDVVIDMGVDREYVLIESDMLADGGVIFVNALFETAATAWEVLGGERPVAALALVPPFFAPTKRLEIAPAYGLSEQARQRTLSVARELFPDCELEVLEDRLGLIAPRILAMIINEAAFAVMEGVASATDIDTAMKLGTNYPEGPLAWCDRIGVHRIVTLLDALFDEYRDERYRTAVLLRQMARAGTTFHSIETNEH